MPRTIRPIRIEGNLAYVALTRGYESVIDAADVHLTEGKNWYASSSHGTVYAVRHVTRLGGGQRTVYLHRAIMDPPDGVQIDHRDSSGLNNSRVNLRPATQSQNTCNSRVPEHNTSGVKGVSWHKAAKKWRAQITLDGIGHHLGYFATPAAAGVAYAKASVRLHGAYGRTA